MIQLQTLHSRNLHRSLAGTFISPRRAARKTSKRMKKKDFRFNSGLFTWWWVGSRRTKVIQTGPSRNAGLIHHHLKYPVLFPLAHRARNILARDNKVNTVYVNRQNGIEISTWKYASHPPLPFRSSLLRNCSLHSLLASIQAAVYKTYGIVGRSQQRRVLFDLRRCGDHTTLRVLQYVLGQMVGGWIWWRKGDQEGLRRG